MENISSEDKQCEFEVTYTDTIFLEKPYECALLQATLPNKMFINRFPSEYSIFLNMVWIKSFKLSSFQEYPTNPALYDK